MQECNPPGITEPTEIKGGEEKPSSPLHTNRLFLLLCLFKLKLLTMQNPQLNYDPFSRLFADDIQGGTKFFFTFVATINQFIQRKNKKYVQRF